MPLLECTQLTRRFGALVAVDHVDLAVEPGETRAVIGPNGAGKSTLFNVITGVLAASEGSTTFDGEVISGLPVHEIVQKGMSRTFQLTHMFPNLTARENVVIAAQARHSGRRRMIGGAAVLRECGERADEALERLRLSHFANVQANMLAHGDQRLLEVAMAISQRPKLLLLDEPTQGLSIEETDQAVKILRDMLDAGNLTVILVEHDMEVVFKLADRITVLHQGRAIADGTPSEVQADEDVQRAYLGGLE